MGIFVFLGNTDNFFFPLILSFCYNGGHNPAQWINLTGLYPGNVYMSHYQLLPGSLDRDVKPAHI